MGIPYSREINAAFDQVTPLVAAGFQVLKTTRNISILLAVIQVLTVVLLAGILFVLLALVYCVNPDLQHERDKLVTPFFRSLAKVTVLGVVESAVFVLVGFVGFLVMGVVVLRVAKGGELEKAKDENGEGKDGKDGKK
ncbi:hypothetical protein M011DRAFT_154429 [Sporormia fimetaria CBS 119925]|uniref:Uncharacterized protein n=1 Tax=Sporormia fimetaria CBS 119925 TaxID=1340428 RepID=A0A6A6V730_9PLEO|nr:hypothetical protein M011DRAFT_154429 [Sporormia fimetaria CBS 119925]